MKNPMTTPATKFSDLSDVWTLRYVYKQVEYWQFLFIQALIMLMFCFVVVERHFISTFYIKVLDSCIITY